MIAYCRYTGLAFSDVKGLKQEHLVRDNTGALWIRKKREKTNNMCNIPLLDIPKQILEKYKDYYDGISSVNSDRLLPVLSNQKMNAYLKEIADICGIQKDLTTHIGKHNKTSHLLNHRILQVSILQTGNNKETSKVLCFALFLHNIQRAT